MPAYNFDNTGKLKSPSQEQLQEADGGAMIVAYTTGTMQDGRDYYAYVGVKPSKYREFSELSEKRAPLRLNDYGRVLMAGFEQSAPAEVVKAMREQYGFDEHYEQALRVELERQRDKAGEKQEEKRLMDIVAMMKAKKG